MATSPGYPTTPAATPDIAVLDHVVIGRQDFASLKQRGLGFRP